MSEYAQKDKEELLRLLKEKRVALRAWRFAVSGAKTKNVKEGMNLRRQIARILTEARAREKAR
ncbi:MAG: 50S ribosomal protein L29 [Candidatus Taylorbacteria bacterium]|nr:50S ribosomal protein L29 [Candidatus Taylorbacteria bacterium]